MKKLCYIVLTVILVISVGFNVYQFHSKKNIQAGIDACKTEYENLVSDGSELEEQISSITIQIDEMSQRLADLELENENATAENTGLKESITDLQKQIEEYEETASAKRNTGVAKTATSEQPDTADNTQMDAAHQAVHDEVAAKLAAFGATDGSEMTSSESTNLGSSAGAGVQWE